MVSLKGGCYVKDQNEEIRKKLISALKKEMKALALDGWNQTKIAKQAGTNQPFISNFLNDNEEGMNGLALPKLISMANGLGLKLKLDIGHSSKKKNAA